MAEAQQKGNLGWGSSAAVWQEALAQHNALSTERSPDKEITDANYFTFDVVICD